MTGLSEVWCASCDRPAVKEIETTNGTRAFCAEHLFAATSSNFNGERPRCGVIPWGAERCVRGVGHDDPRLATPAPHMIRLNRRYYLVTRSGQLVRTVR